MERAPVSWVIDPDDPRAPPQEIWDRMTPEERQRVVDALPSEFDISEASLPEGDFHFNAKVAARDTLGGYFQSIGKRVYLACELPVYYPAGRMVAPDLIAVRDVEVKERACWSVSAEGKGVDLAMEILWNERSKEELENIAARYASLGIPEYFVFDRRRRRLCGFRLAAGSARYEPIARQAGRLTSAVLDLDLGLEGDRLCFYYALARLPEPREVLARFRAMVNDLMARREEAEQRLEEAEQRLEEERLRADEAERRLAEVLVELERLRRERG
ncbi:Uma2 family endonuclease [Sorangium sp. So ce1078]|uniref:Uma2 family endonuclease n=1 Tax=Sorangium sp. So ce1078 TaxID=3133329 RepID=UPI003F645B17